MSYSSIYCIVAFRSLAKSTISFVISFCLSVCLSIRPLALHPAWHNSDLTGHIFTNVYIYFFENLSAKFMLHWNLTGITGTSQEHPCTFTIISRSVLLRMRNDSNKSCTENQNTHFMFNGVIPKIVPFVR